MNATIKIVGAAAIISNLKRFVTGFDSKAEKALDDVAFNILAESRDQAPFDIGTLIKSSKVEKSAPLQRTISYNTPYAVKLHEHPEFHFRNGRKAKYLEDPLKKFAGRGLRELQKELKF